jgi:oligopeptide transport system ATP-binding protein
MLIPKPQGKIFEGEIIFDNKNVLDMSIKDLQGFRGNRVSMIFQDPMTSLNPVFTIGNQLTEAITSHRSLNKKTAREESYKLLEMVGISDIKRRFSSYPHEFSGGMRQRVMIAMAIANSPDILIADEPTTALDVTIQAQILELMDELKQKTRSSIILITHDLGVVAKYADRVIVMYAGKPVEFSDIDTVFYKPCHPYTLGLMKSITRLDKEKKDTLKPIEGNPPSLIDLPDGCVFCVRCEYVISKCKHKYPPLSKVEKGHNVACFRADEFLSGKLSRNL